MVAGDHVETTSNLITEPDHYPMPNIADFTNSIGTARVLSKLDLPKRILSGPCASSRRAQNTIMTPFGSYVFHYSTFGLKNSGATFQWMMDSNSILMFCHRDDDKLLIKG